MRHVEALKLRLGDGGGGAVHGLLMAAGAAVAAGGANDVDQGFGGQKADRGVERANGIEAGDAGAREAALDLKPHSPGKRHGIGHVVAEPGEEAHVVDGRDNQRLVGLGAVEAGKGGTDTSEAGLEAGMQRREVGGEAEMAYVPKLLNVGGAAGGEAATYFGPVIEIGAPCDVGPADAFADDTNPVGASRW